MSFVETGAAIYKWMSYIIIISSNFGNSNILCVSKFCGCNSLQTHAEFYDFPCFATAILCLYSHLYRPGNFRLMLNEKKLFINLC